jgi:hypothetical protein
MKQMGYLMVDHRASPGLTEEAARQVGYDPALCREGKLFETDTMTCAHCKCAVVKNPLRQRERPHCSKCNHYVCDLCAAQMSHPDYSHTPFEKLVDASLSGTLKLQPSPLGLICV